MFNCIFRVMHSFDTLEFGKENDPRRIKLCVKFVTPAIDSTSVKGVMFVADGRSEIPEGVQLRDEMGEPMTPGDGHILPKAHNACSVDVDGENFELFSVHLVDGGGRDSMDSSGGVLHFHSEEAKDGILKPDPHRGLE